MTLCTDVRCSLPGNHTGPCKSQDGGEDAMMRLSFEHPDCVGSSEYRAVYELIDETMPDDEAEQIENAIAILEEFGNIARTTLARLKAKLAEDDDEEEDDDEDGVTECPHGMAVCPKC